MNPSAPQVLASFSLDQDRLAIATRVDRNVVVLAGPGAGKTHLLVAHAVWLAHESEGRVVLLTYSRKAAGEMRNRANAALSTDSRRLVVATTIHAYALDLLHAHGHRLGIPVRVEILDRKDIQALSDEVARLNGHPTMEDFASDFERYQRLRGDLQASDIPELVRLVDKEMRATGQLDWDSCIRLATELLAVDPHVRATVRHHDRSFLLDEAQDCDANQLAFMEQLLGPPPGDRHLFVVMDPDQSLYAFRQANPELVREWAGSYASDETEVTENFRCAPRIQVLAKHVLEKSTTGPLKPGTASTEAFSNYVEEAEWVTNAVNKRILDGQEPRRIAVLGRRRNRLVDVERELATKVAVRSDPREQWTPPEERILAAIAFLMNWRDGRAPDDDVAKTFLVDVLGLTGEQALTLQQDALRAEKHPGEFVTVPWWLDLTAWLEDRRSPEEVVEYLASAAGVKVDEIRPLKVIAQHARGLNDMLRLSRAGPDLAQSAQQVGVLVTTFHGAKGLEFDTVFVVGTEDGTIPDFRARSEKELRDERRMLYVAVTRASKEICLTRVTSQKGYPKRPCRFLPEEGSPIWESS
jgi:DNA helicase-2/ATP-dependent DNA helicase PcrA